MSTSQETAPEMVETVEDDVKTAAKGARTLVIVLVVALVAALVALALVATDAKRQRDEADAGEAAQKAARAAVVAMTTYDYATIDDDFAWVDDAGTAKFRKQYAEVSAPITKLVVELKAHAKGTVVDSAVRVEDGEHATVLLFVDQTLTNPGQKQPGLDQPRITMKMVKEDGDWLVDEVELHTVSGSNAG